MPKENRTFLLTLEVLFLSFFATAVCHTFDLWMPAGGMLPMETLDIWGGMGAQPIDPQEPLSWWGSLARYYNLENWNTLEYHRMTALGWYVRIGLSLIPWSFFGLGIVRAVYSEIRHGELLNPLLACSQMARRMFPLKLVFLMACLTGAFWEIFMGFNIVSGGKQVYPAAFFFFSIAGFIGAFSINAFFPLLSWARSQHADSREAGTTRLSFLIWTFRNMLRLFLALLYSVACTAGAGFLMFQAILFLVPGSREETLGRQQIAILSALGFLPTVALNGLFWAALPWSLIRFFSPTEKKGRP